MYVIYHIQFASNKLSYDTTLKLTDWIMDMQGSHNTMPFYKSAKIEGNVHSLPFDNAAPHLYDASGRSSVFPEEKRDC